MTWPSSAPACPGSLPASGWRISGGGSCIFERHSAPGGLNSYYSLDGRKYDVGLHAMTNYVPPGVKGTPLGKLLRQLRIGRDEFALCPQKQSRIAFGSRGASRAPVHQRLRGAGGRDRREVSRTGRRIPAPGRRGAGLRRSRIRRPRCSSAREIVRRHISDPLLEDMLFCPLMYYGNARERDMDLSQFVIMFRAVFLEGLARPLEGMRRIIRVLLEKYRSAGGERRMQCGVARIVEHGGRAAALVLDGGEEITADQVISSIGAEETAAVCSPPPDPEIRAAAGGAENPGLGRDRRLSFIESIRVLKHPPSELGWGSDTIVFFNDTDRFEYARPAQQADVRSGVICLPNNFDFGDAGLQEGWLRITCLANYDRWAGLPEERYQADKLRWLDESTRSARRFLPEISDAALAAETLATDLFTPRTVKRFTGHVDGAIYGAPAKIHGGRTHLKNLHLCGTDQGLMGIVGAMISGIAIANEHVLRPGAGA